MIGGFKNVLSKLTQIQAKANTVRIIIIVIIVLLIFSVVSYIINKMKLNKKNCTNLSQIYEDFPKISSVNPDNAEFKYNLRDYYIKTAFNCCCAGQFKNDYVNDCALINVIKQGARCLDFEIYSVNNKPVVATSSVKEYTIKETYNSIPFSDAMNIVANYAFSNSTCPNPHDPLMLHFRIMSNNKQIYKIMAKTISEQLDDKILASRYSYEYDGKNLGAVPLKELLGKVIIIVDKQNKLYESTPLDEFVNIASNSVFMRASRNYDIIYTPDMQELIEYNKKNMIITMPDLSPKYTNVSPALHMKYGCQLIGMCFQNFDNNMEYYSEFFDGNGSAFVLKPENLRYIPVIIPTPPKQSPALSYATRKVKSDYYSYKI